jgi:hypothetical protein
MTGGPALIEGTLARPVPRSTPPGSACFPAAPVSWRCCRAAGASVRSWVGARVWAGAGGPGPGQGRRSAEGCPSRASNVPAFLAVRRRQPAAPKILESPRKSIQDLLVRGIRFVRSALPRRRGIPGRAVQAAGFLAWAGPARPGLAWPGSVTSDPAWLALGERIGDFYSLGSSRWRSRAWLVAVSGLAGGGLGPGWWRSRAWLVAVSGLAGGGLGPGWWRFRAWLVAVPGLAGGGSGPGRSPSRPGRLGPDGYRTFGPSVIRRSCTYHAYS